jgi:DNA-binding NarL/FixJ family response regulator
LLVDDDALVRAGLKIILSSAEDLEVVGEVGDGSGAVAAVNVAIGDAVNSPLLDSGRLGMLALRL